MTEIHASVNIYCQGTHPPLIVTLFWENMNKSLKKRHWENHQYEVGSKKNQENQIPGSTTSCHIIYLWIKHPEIECRRKKNIFSTCHQSKIDFSNLSFMGMTLSIFMEVQELKREVVATIFDVTKGE